MCSITHDLGATMRLSQGSVAELGVQAEVPRQDNDSLLFHITIDESRRVPHAELSVLEACSEQTLGSGGVDVAPCQAVESA